MQLATELGTQHIINNIPAALVYDPEAQMLQAVDPVPNEFEGKNKVKVIPNRFLR